jgi:hypothetical protein
MPRVVPSDVVDFIDQLWPRLDENDISKSESGEIAGLLDLTERIPEELLHIDSRAYAEFVCAQAHIRTKLAAWTNNPKEPDWLGHMTGIGKQRPVNVIRKVLVKCPDSHPGPGIAELAFITNTELREALRIDMSEASRALSNGEWKAATVLSGSVVEALLFWYLQPKTETELDAAIAAVTLRETQQHPKPKVKKRRRASELEWWSLEQFIDITEELGRIGENTAKGAHLARDFRNLIHPAAAKRNSRRCSRATAHVAVAAMELVAEDLARPQMT